MQFMTSFIQPVNLHLIDAVIHGTEIFIVRRGDHTADMGPETALRHAADSLVEYAVHHASQPAVPVGVNHGNLAVVISGHEQIFSCLIHGKITAAHTSDVYFIDIFQIPIRMDGKHCHTLVSDGVQIFSAFGPCQIGGVVNRNHFPFPQHSFFHIHVVKMNPDTASMCIGTY